MNTDTLGISVTLGCASGDVSRLDDVLEQLRREGLEPVVLSGLDRNVLGLGDAIDRSRGPAVYVLCQSQTLARRQVIRLSGMFSARRGPLHTLLVVDLDTAQSDSVMRLIRGAIGALTQQGGGSPRDEPQNEHLRDIVGPTRVTVVNRTDADAQRRRASAESGEWRQPAADDTNAGSPTEPPLPPPTTSDDADPGDTLVLGQGPGPVGLPGVNSEADHKPSRTTKMQQWFAVDESNPSTIGHDGSHLEQRDLIELPPLNTDHRGLLGEPMPVTPTGPHLDGHNPLVDNSQRAMSRTWSGWPHQPTAGTPGAESPFPTLDATVPEQWAPTATPQSEKAAQSPPDATAAPEQGADTRPGWAPERPMAERSSSRGGATMPAAAPTESTQQWPMSWAENSEPAPPTPDPTTPTDKTEPTASPAASRKQIAGWFLAGMMTLAASWAVISSAIGEFAPAPAGGPQPRTRAAGAVLPGQPAPAPTPGSEAQLIATALANGDLRALDTLLIAPSSGEHRSFFQADDHCRNGSFAHLRGFRLPRSVELGQLAGAGFLGDGRYWSSTPGAADFGEGMQIYDSWVKGLMVTQHDAPDVLTVCVRVR